MKRIALVFDFDETLCPDSTDAYLKENNVSTHEFWSQTKNLMSSGYDPVTAYMNLMLTWRYDFNFKITQKSMIDFSKKINFFNGVGLFFKTLLNVYQNNCELSFYIISSGLDDIIKHSSIAHFFKGIYASKFIFNNEGLATGIKRVVSFTDKTRFLFAISKGITPNDYYKNPLSVNKLIKNKDYPIPLHQFIYFGDGYSDIPCFALLNSFKGYTFAISKNKTNKLASLLIEEHRVNDILPIDYTPQRALYNRVVQTINAIIKESNNDQ